MELDIRKVYKADAGRYYKISNVVQISDTSINQFQT